MKRLMVILLCFLAVTLNSQTVDVYTTPLDFNTTLTIPSGATTIIIECWGGGGGGGGVSGNPAAGGGGRGGSYGKKTFADLAAMGPGTPVYRVGSGGVGGTGNNGGDGNYSAVSYNGQNTSVIAGEGAGGFGGTANSTNYSGATTEGGTPTSGLWDVTYTGGNGSNGNYTSGGGAGGGGAGSTGNGGNASGSTGGTGTSQNGGNGANGVGSSSAGSAGSNYGGGGSGGRANNNTNRNGGAGAQGIVRVTYTPAGQTRKIYIIHIADDSEVEKVLNFMESNPPPIKFERDEKPEIIVRYPNGLQRIYNSESAVRWNGQPYRLGK